MESGWRTYGEELVVVLSAATAALRDLPEQAHRLTGPDLEKVLTVVDALAAVSAAGRFTVTDEAVARGEVAGSQAGSVAQWVADRCSSLDARGAGLVAKAVRVLGAPGLAAARRAVADGRLSVSAGCVVATELAQLTPLVEPSAVDAVATGLVAMGEIDGPVGVRRVRPAMLARYGLGSVLQEVEDRHRGLTVLSCGHDIGGGITEYRMRLNPEARAVLEAAIAPASAPNPVAGESRALDERTIDQRRGDALVDVCRRAVATSPAAAPSGVKATVMVTIGLDDLRDRTRPGTLLGGLDAGTPLGPETVRKLACDTGIIPVVLAGDGAVLDLGRTQRLFSTAQVRALWLRDGHCTFDSCTTPASWCDAHHLRHWVDGGATDLLNAALLCGRHHTIVHRDRLSATLTGGSTGAAQTSPCVVWDRAPGSYDRSLASRASLACAGPDP